MKKVLFSIGLISILLLTSSCKKILKPNEDDSKVSFVVRVYTTAFARFEAQCVSEDIFLDKIIVQSPSALSYIEEMGHVQLGKDEFFAFGNQEAEDGVWLLTFIGVTALTDEAFQTIVPYEMVIIADNNE